MCTTVNQYLIQYNEQQHANHARVVFAKSTPAEVAVTCSGVCTVPGTLILSIAAGKAHLKEVNRLDHKHIPPTVTSRFTIDRNSTSIGAVSISRVSQIISDLMTNQMARYCRQSRHRQQANSRQEQGTNPNMPEAKAAVIISFT